MAAGPYNYSYIFKYIIIGKFFRTNGPLGGWYRGQDFKPPYLKKQLQELKQLDLKLRIMVIILDKLKYDNR